MVKYPPFFLMLPFLRFRQKRRARHIVIVLKYKIEAWIFMLIRYLQGIVIDKAASRIVEF